MLDINKEVAAITAEITALRNHLHENPELSMQEFKTCDYLEDYVKKNINYDCLKRVGKTGFFFVIKGTKPGKGPSLAFRGDIDALPIQEDPACIPIGMKTIISVAADYLDFPLC
jgi:metal-dependent amidase/aminoacylase/carboxypeptidase family protein